MMAELAWDIDIKVTYNPVNNKVQDELVDEF